MPDEQLVVQLTAIYNGDLTFSWNSVHGDCPSVYYSINSSNCGVCPENVTSTTVTCTDVYGDSNPITDVCVISIQSFVCDNIHGSISDIVTVSIQSKGNKEHTLCICMHQCIVCFVADQRNVVVLTEVLVSMIIRSVYLEVLHVVSVQF